MPSMRQTTGILRITWRKLVNLNSSFFSLKHSDNGFTDRWDFKGDSSFQDLTGRITADINEHMLILWIF